MSAIDTEKKWGDIPPFLEGANTVMDSERNFIMRVACKKHDDRSQSKNGKVPWTRGRVLSIML